MTYPELLEIKASLLSKQHTKLRLKPAEEGFNNGLRTAISIFEQSIGKDYKSIQHVLLSQQKTGRCTNREEGFNDALLRAASKLKEIHMRTINSSNPGSPSNEVSVDTIAASAKDELEEAGKFVYPLSQNFWLNFSVEFGSYDSMNPDREFYSVMLLQSSTNGFEKLCVSYADYNDFSGLREACQHCLDFYKRTLSLSRTPLSSQIESAQNNSESGRVQSHTNTEHLIEF